MMKLKAYLAVILVFNGFISHNMHAITGPKGLAKRAKRWAQCAFQPSKYKCSSDEKASARKWLIGTSVVIIAAVAAGLGMKMTKDQIRKSKQDAQEQSGEDPVQVARKAIRENIQTLVNIAQEVSNLSTQFEEIVKNAGAHFSKRDIEKLRQDIKILKEMPQAFSSISDTIDGLKFSYDISLDPAKPEMIEPNSDERWDIQKLNEKIKNLMSNISQEKINNVLRKLREDLTFKITTGR